LAVSVIDDGHAGVHPATVAENSFAGLMASAISRTDNFGLSGGADQNK
jgi:hypothetical protein